jgi:uncharacterized membrane protein YoaK (UPF0700 family)
MAGFDAESKAEIDAAGRSVRHPLTRALLVLTVTTGLIDAVSYLGLGHVFTANMTGNIVFLGFGIAGAGGLPVVSPLISLAAFLTGAGAGGVLGSRAARSPREHLSLPLLIEAALVGAAALLVAAVDIEPNHFSGDAVIAMLALAMGMRNATVRRLAIPDMTTTVLTMTLTGLAADSTAGGGTGAGSIRRTAAVAAMLAGAVAGALMLKTSLFLPLAVAALLAAVTWLSYIPRQRGLSGRRSA